MQVYSAEKTYASLFGTSYTASLEALVLNAGLPVDVATGRYASKPTITLTPSGGFQVWPFASSALSLPQDAGKQESRDPLPTHLTCLPYHDNLAVLLILNDLKKSFLIGWPT